MTQTTNLRGYFEKKILVPPPTTMSESGQKVCGGGGWVETNYSVKLKL